MEAGEPVVNVKSTGVPAEQIVCVAVEALTAAVVSTVTVVEKVEPVQEPEPRRYTGVTVITTSLFSSLLFINVPVVNDNPPVPVTELPLEPLTLIPEGSVAGNFQWYSIV
jgi:hypothetical protein